MLVNSGGLGFSEADEIDYVGKYFDETIMSGFEEVVEGEIVDAALLWSIRYMHGLSGLEDCTSTSSFRSEM